jgi:hypothetical protein
MAGKIFGGNMNFDELASAEQTVPCAIDSCPSCYAWRLVATIGRGRVGTFSLPFAP